MNIEVITAKPEHATAVSYIGRTAFRDAFNHLFNSGEELESYLDYTYAVEKIADSIGKENNVFFLALADGSPAGFGKVKKHSLNPQCESVFQTELQKIYVLEQYHGQGISGALMKAVLQLVRSIEPEYLWLDTHIGNDRAIRFYEKHGFKKYAKHHFTIGTQTFEYHVMMLPVAVEVEVEEDMQC